MRAIAIIAAVLTVSIALAGAANAAPKKRYHPVVERSAAGTVIQPTRTIIHHRDGTTTIIREYGADGGLAARSCPDEIAPASASAAACLHSQPTWQLQYPRPNRMGCQVK